MIFSSCQETRLEPLALKGTIKGNVQTYGAGSMLDNHADVKVYVGTDLSEPIAVTDEQGDFMIDELTTGTYKFLFAKDGFDTAKIEAIPFLGGKAPVYLNTKMTMYHSATEIKNMNVEAVNEYLIIINMDIETEMSTHKKAVAGVQLFLGDLSKVSSKEYIGSRGYDLLVIPGVVNSITVHLFMPLLFTGDTLYLIAYGADGRDFGNHYNENQEKIYTGLGSPTEILTICIP
ncbi:MAG: carboxypeptidase regulatory-like domain-containing protein [Cyclobacteriaceae bacterium]|nr:carboxypeptidase regulatory-like domain-containing protein [Cyclobacteriaceae bacterium]